LNQELTPIVPKARKTRIPDNAVLSERQAAIASEEGITPDEAEAQFARFRDNAVANGKTFASWDAAWRNWLRSPFFKPITRSAHGNRTNGNFAGGRENRPDPAIEQIARLARLGKAQGYDRG
jgi:hypothetical protein